MKDCAEEFDVIVVGAGISGGLPAAAYLQKAGCSVAVIERDKHGAPFSSFYERAPGVRFDVTPVNFSIMSPAIADLDLAAYGYRFSRSDIVYSTLDGSGRSITFFADPARSRPFGLFANKTGLKSKNRVSQSKGLNSFPMGMWRL